MNDIFGITAFLWPIAFIAIGSAYISPTYSMHWWRWCGFFLLTIFFLTFSSAFSLNLGDLHGGGMLGDALQRHTSYYLSPSGSSLLWIFILLVGLQLAFNFSWFAILINIIKYIKNKRKDNRENNKEKNNILENKVDIKSKSSFFNKEFWINLWNEIGAIKASTEKMPEIYEEKTVEENESETISLDTEAIEDEESDIIENKDEEDYEDKEKIDTKVEEKKPLKRAKIPLPPIDLLIPAKPEKNNQEDRDGRANALMSCLKDFDIQGQLVRITPGPVVTMYEVKPAPGIRVNRIASLSDDLALALKAISVRIQAPIPGSDTVGIEIPNDHREMVNFRELVENDAFRKGCGPLTMILGKDISGKPYFADLSKMPHLLIAGATGAGKSVCLNTILMSFLCRAQPTDLQLLLIDPKRVEMAVYADEPHLAHPVIKDMQDAKNALSWAENEMTERLKAFDRIGAKNIISYNQKLESFNNKLPEELGDLKPYPYLVIIIDELADLMMTAAQEVEKSIIRLAQLARAAGIHMILATQRPSVDVVTGLIKANFLCRISFQVTAKHDSRTILDQVGAENLLGKGDMLFKSSGGRLLRLHGPYLTDEEVQAVVMHWKHYLTPNYSIDLTQFHADTKSTIFGMSTDASDDALYPDIQKFALEQGNKTSISSIQRHFKIGFNRAARLKEQLEKDGFLSVNNKQNH